jgi:hypothetical protein
MAVGRLAGKRCASETPQKSKRIASQISLTARQAFGKKHLPPRILPSARIWDGGG